MALRLWWLMGFICVVYSRQDRRLFSKTPLGFLRCRTGVTLAMYPDRAVNGTRDNRGKFASLQVSFIGINRINVVFFGLLSKMYLCMSNTGALYGKTFGI
ncbi:hypothetical protein TNCT_654021 [Trichonephila clavata]|uniref:Secreted protein n=1 Tax=Trichonephila clavata TaxID=2740835 RepID=A0A8X6I898_TRICU|nr:hypothetical protein TNCT_654021 [Trichonephila clavata]